MNLNYRGRAGSWLLAAACCGVMQSGVISHNCRAPRQFKKEVVRDGALVGLLNFGEIWRLVGLGGREASEERKKGNPGRDPPPGRSNSETTAVIGGSARSTFALAVVGNEASSRLGVEQPAKG